MADLQFSECSPVTSKPSIRRRGCVVCLRQTPNAYVTSFTKVAEKQEVWVNRLANGDEGFANHLKKNVDFIRHDFSEENEPSTSEPLVSLEDEAPEIPAKRQKLEVSLAGKGAELDVASMTYLLDTVNLYVTRAMEEADKK